MSITEEMAISVMKGAPTGSQLNVLGHIADGKRELNKLYGYPYGYPLRLSAYPIRCEHKNNIVEVRVDLDWAGQITPAPKELVFLEELETFPSPELKAKIMLLAP